MHTYFKNRCNKSFGFIGDVSLLNCCVNQDEDTGILEQETWKSSED